MAGQDTQPRGRSGSTNQGIKFDPDFVKGLLSKERMLPPIFEGMKVLKMGNSEAENTIILALSPSCASCGRAFWEVQQLVHKNTQFRIEIVFSTSNEANDIGGQVARGILSLPIEQMEEATQKWFQNTKQDHRNWKLSLGLNNETEIDFERMAFHLRWLELADVISAPAIFLNKAEIHSVFGVQDIEKLYQIAQNAGFANQK